MGTDDLTRRARTYAEALHGSADAALVSELADVVDRRGAVVDTYKEMVLLLREDVQAALAERDAARAALERVRGVIKDGDRLDGLWIYAPDLDRALEGRAEAPTQQHRCTCRQLAP